jgi:hypothetical protein
MKTVRPFALFLSVSLVAIAPSLSGCEKKPEPTKSTTRETAAQNDHATSTEHSHGNATQLGEQIAGGFKIKASCDGAILAGKDAPIDVWVLSPDGTPAKPAAVRFWIGTEDAKGSVKAKAALEKDNWHTHAEVPSPLPAGSKLWIEVEANGGGKTIAGFDLKF